jgi:hypothetical protein
LTARPKVPVAELRLSTKNPGRGFAVVLGGYSDQPLLSEVAALMSEVAALGSEDGGMSLCPDAVIDDIGHRYSGMAFVIYTFSVADQQDLWRLMVYGERLGDLIRNGPVADEVKIIEIDGLGLLSPLEPVFDQGAGRAAGAVLKNDLRASGGPLFDLGELIFLL